MKICTKCGAHNSDERFFCVDCNEKLGDKLPAAEEMQILGNLDEQIEEIYNNKDPLYVSAFDKVMGIVSLVGVLICFVLMVIGNITERNFNYLWIAVVLLLLSSIEALIPKITWAFEKIRLSFFINDPENAEPSGFYIACRKIAIILSAAVGIVLLTLHLLDFTHAPVRKYISDIAATESVATSSHTKDYISANQNKWEIILNEGNYSVNIFVNELKKADSTGLEEQLMMDAITEITGNENVSYSSKDDFLFMYNFK